MHPVLLSRPPRALLVLAALTIGTAATPAGAADEGEGDLLDLEWDAPPECPARATALGDIRRLVGRTPKDAPRVSAHVYLTEAPGGRWHAHITTLGESGGERTLAAASCPALVEATVLVLALRIKPSLMADVQAPPSAAASAPLVVAPPVVPVPAPPEKAPDLPPVAPPTPPDPPRPDARPARRPWGFVAGASALFTAGELPSIDASPELTVGYVRGRLRVLLHGEGTILQDTTSQSGAPGAAVHAVGGGARVCYGPAIPAFKRLTVFGCVDGELDWMWATGRAVPDAQTQNAGWVTVGLGAGASLEVGHRLGVHLMASGLAPFTRPTFDLETAQKTEVRAIYQPSAEWGRLEVGVDVILF